MERWVDKVALVTGASAGIGAAICRELLKKGMIVVGCARNVKSIRDIVEEDEMCQYKKKLFAVQCDISREESIVKMFDEIRSKLNRLHVCINNAMSITDSSLIYGKTSDWRFLLEMGILGMCICTREAVKLMRECEAEDAQIIQMGSVVGHKIPPFQKPQENTETHWFHIYNAVKTMMRPLTEGLRQELKAENLRIRVATISPGHVETELLPRCLNKDVPASLFDGERLQPKDIVDIVTYILSTPTHVNVNDVIVEPLDFMIQG